MKPLVDKENIEGEPVAGSAAEESHEDPWQYAGDDADAPTDDSDDSGGNT